MTTQEKYQRHDQGSPRPSSREIHSDIARTRHDMDETLDELGERLNPKHLLDYVVDYFRSGSGSSTTHEAKEQLKVTSRHAARQVKQHPVPYALMAAGAAWWLLESGDKDEAHNGPRAAGLRRHSGSYVDARTGEPYDAGYGADREEKAVPWHAEYDWSRAHEDESAWKAKARTQLNSLKAMLEDSSRSPSEKLKGSAESLLAISGRKRREIHARWADLSAHSGSFVDARTGEPYDESYGQEWQHLAACDYFADYSPDDEDAKRWSEQASEVVEQIRSTVATGGDNVKETLSRIASKIGHFGASTGAVARSSGGTLRGGAGRLGSNVSSGIHRMAGGASSGMQHLTGGAQHMAGSAQEQLRRGYRATRRQAVDAVYEYPLAAGAAALGLGLLAGFLLPRTRTEDHWMGGTSDELKDQAQEAADDAMERGRRVASATGSAAMDEARKQGLTPETAGAKARQTVTDAAEKAEATIQETSREVADKAGEVAERAKRTAEKEASRQSEDIRG